MGMKWQGTKTRWSGIAVAVLFAVLVPCFAGGRVVDISRAGDAAYLDSLGISSEGNRIVLRDEGTTYTLTGANTSLSIAAGASVRVELGGVEIQSSGDFAALDLAGHAVEVSLLAGTSNRLAGSGLGAGLQVETRASLILSGEGELTAGGGGAGIGGARGTNCGNIWIKGGTVTATGGQGSAGIGDGRRNPPAVLPVPKGLLAPSRRIAISGGTITAKGGRGAAGIGMGWASGYERNKGREDGVEIVITGGTVTAEGDNSGAGIGGGTHSMSKSISISGGDIHASGGAGIGCGYGSHMDGGEITISGGRVTAIGQGYGAGIGGGENGDGGRITIHDGEITATGGQRAAGIGGGATGQGGAIAIYGGNVVANSGPSVFGGGAGIGGGWGGGAGTTLIAGGTVVANGVKQAAGIGGGYFGTGGDIAISGGTVTATGGEQGAGIGGGWANSGDPRFGSGGDVKIAGGSVKATGGEGAQAIGKGGGTGGPGSLTDGSGRPVFRRVIPGVAGGTQEIVLTVELDGGGTYVYAGHGHAGDSSLYFYLPDANFTVVPGGGMATASGSAAPSDPRSPGSVPAPTEILDVAINDGAFVFSVDPAIQRLTFKVQGAESVVDGAWQFHDLEKGVDFEIDGEGRIRILTLQPMQIIRILL